MASPPVRATSGPAPLWPLIAAAGALVPLALGMCFYFAVNSSLGASLILARLAPGATRGGVEAARIQWGPNPTRLSAVHIRATNWQGRQTLTARAVTLKVAGSSLLTLSLQPREVALVDAVVANVDGGEGLSAGHLSAQVSLAAGGPVRLSQVVAEDFGVRLGWAADGRFSLEDAFRFKPRGPPPPPDRPDKPKRAGRAVHIDGVTLRRGVVTLTWPSTALSFEAVDCSGDVAIAADGGLEIRADLTGGASSAAWGAAPRRRRVAYDSVTIAAFRWIGEGFSTEGVELLGGGGARVALAGELGVKRAGAATVRGDVRVSAEHARTLLGPVAPEGGGVNGLDVVLDEAGISGDFGRLEVPVLATGPTTLRGLSAPIRGTLAPSSLTGVAGKLEITGAKLARADGPEGVSAEDIAIGRLGAEFGAALDATVADVSVQGFNVPQGRVGASNASGRLIVGLAGGRLEGRVDTPDGRATARGDISLSLLTQKATFRTALELTDLRGALARSVLVSLPPGVREEVAAPLSGQAVYVGTVARRKGADGRRRWTPRFRLEQGALEGGGGRVEYADTKWRPRAAAAAAPRPAHGAPGPP